MDGEFHTQECLELENGSTKIVSFDPTTNMLIFCMAPSSCTYCTFATTLKALEAPYFCMETVLKYPGHRHMNNKAALVPEEFISEENVNVPKMCQSIRKLMPTKKW